MRYPKNAFTLIEVMVAVVIISVVIMGLMQMYSNNLHIFASLKKQTLVNGYSSFLVGHKTYGFEDEEITLYRLVEDFDLETDLRRSLKEIKIEILYQELAIPLFEEEGMEDEPLDEEVSSEIGFEMGRSIIKTKEASSALVRLRLQ